MKLDGLRKCADISETQKLLLHSGLGALGGGLLGGGIGYAVKGKQGILPGAGIGAVGGGLAGYGISKLRASNKSKPIPTGAEKPPEQPPLIPERQPTRGMPSDMTYGPSKDSRLDIPDNPYLADLDQRTKAILKNDPGLEAASFLAINKELRNAATDRTRILMDKHTYPAGSAKYDNAMQADAKVWDDLLDRYRNFVTDDRVLQTEHLTIPDAHALMDASYYLAPLERVRSGRNLPAPDGHVWANTEINKNWQPKK